jgi:hypothetical protein
MTTYTKDVAILQIRRCWQNGLTLSQAWERMSSRYKFTDKQKLVSEWKKMKKIFGCASLSFSYLQGTYGQKATSPTAQELNRNTGMFGSYGDWKGITGPGKQLRESLTQ